LALDISPRAELKRSMALEAKPEVALEVKPWVDGADHEP
jgi:hypothetical protein